MNNQVGSIFLAVAIIFVLCIIFKPKAKPKVKPKLPDLPYNAYLLEYYDSDHVHNFVRLIKALGLPDHDFHNRGRGYGVWHDDYDDRVEVSCPEPQFEIIKNYFSLIPAPTQEQRDRRDKNHDAFLSSSSSSGGGMPRPIHYTGNKW